jgi:hypothetical protein
LPVVPPFVPGAMPPPAVLPLPPGVPLPPAMGTTEVPALPASLSLGSPPTPGTSMLLLLPPAPLCLPDEPVLGAAPLSSPPLAATPADVPSIKSLE